MIYFHRQAVVSPGRLREALRFAAEATAYLNSVLPEVNATAGVGIGGQTGTMYWRAEYADLAALERAQTQLFADDAFQALLVKGAELFLAGSMKDDVIKSL